MTPLAATPVTVNVPEKLYQRLSYRAKHTRRAVEDELMDAVVSGLPGSDELPAGLEAELGQLEVLSNDALWQVARKRFTPDQAHKLERLHLKAQRQTLTIREQKSEHALIQEYERILLIRARAARLLKDRGFDVSSLIA
jgi:plasmid stability protein